MPQYTEPFSFCYSSHKYLHVEFWNTEQRVARNTFTEIAKGKKFILLICQRANLIGYLSADREPAAKERDTHQRNQTQIMFNGVPGSASDGYARRSTFDRTASASAQFNNSVDELPQCRLPSLGIA